MAADLLDFYDKYRGEKMHEIIFSSYGGSLEEGLRLAEIIEREKTPTRAIIFEALSAATLPALACQDRVIFPDPRYMIHNPWTSIRYADAETLRYATEVMEEAQEKAVAFYLSHTTTPEAILREWMKQDTYLTASQLLQYGFATEMITMVEQSEYMTVAMSAKEKMRPAVAWSENLNPVNMSKLVDEIKGLKTMFSAFMARTTVVSLDSGDKLEIKCAKDNPDVGDSVMMNGASAVDGSYKTAETGQVFTIASGKIAAIEMQEPEVTTFDAESVKELVGASMLAVGEKFRELFDKQAEVIASMTTKIETVEAKVNEVTAEKETAENQALNLIAEIKTLKDAVMSTYTPPAANGGANGGTSVGGFKVPTMQEELKKIRERTRKN